MRLDRLDEARQELESMREDASCGRERICGSASSPTRMGDLDEAGRRFGSLISSPAERRRRSSILSSIAEREGRTDLALEGYSGSPRPAPASSCAVRAAQLLLPRMSASRGFRMLDAARRQGTLGDSRRGVRQGGAARGRRRIHGSHRAAAARARAFPRSSGVRYQIALIQDKAGSKRESVRSFESLLKDRPEDASLLNALGYSLADRNQKLPRAETLIARRSRRLPTIPHSSTASAG
jgi:predicted Zn-dependent protease